MPPCPLWPERWQLHRFRFIVSMDTPGEISNTWIWEDVSAPVRFLTRRTTHPFRLQVFPQSQNSAWIFFVMNRLSKGYVPLFFIPLVLKHSRLADFVVSHRQRFRKAKSYDVASSILTDSVLNSFYVVWLLKKAVVSIRTMNPDSLFFRRAIHWLDLRAVVFLFG